MKSFLIRDARVRTHYRGISAFVAGAALCLAVPAVAFASTSAASTAQGRVVVAHHNDGDNHLQTEISGTIISLGSGSITVQDEAGFWRTIVLSASTTYLEGPMKVAPAVSATNLAVGSQVAARGTVDANHTSLDATSVRIELSTVRGTVQTISTSAIVVTSDNGTRTQTIDPTSQTVVFSHSAIVALSSVSVGSFVEGFGILQSDGSLLALYLGVGTAHQSFDNDSDFGFSLPNRTGPNHYGEHGMKK